MVAFLQQDEAAQLDALGKEERTYQDDKVALDRIQNEKLAVVGRYNEDVVAQARQLTQDLKAEEKKREEAAKETARKQAESWRTANREVLSAEGELIQGILGGRQSVGVLLEQIALRTAEREIIADLQYWTERRLLQAEGISLEQAKEEGGVLVHFLQQQQKTVSVISSQAAQTAATTTGVMARSTAEAAGASVTRSILGPLNEKIIMSDAAKAASGAYSAMAGIPIIGPVLGAGAAVAAFAGVMAFENMASLDTGTNYVPHDMPANIHQGERVVPAADNKAMISALNGGGSRGPTALTFAPTYHGAPGADRESFEEFSARNGAEMRKWVGDMIRNRAL